jgi:hypothetical protein
MSKWGIIEAVWSTPSSAQRQTQRRRRNEIDALKPTNNSRTSRHPPAAPAVRGDQREARSIRSMKRVVCHRSRTVTHQRCPSVSMPT